MAQGESGQDHAPDEARLREVAASIDAAADDLDANGPVSADELRRALLGLEADWTGAGSSLLPRQRRAVP